MTHRKLTTIFSDWYLKTRSISSPLRLLNLSLLYPHCLSLNLSSVSLVQSFCDLSLMASQDKGRPLPKFGEWDVNNPASAEGFTVIFAKARDEKKTNGAPGNGGAQKIHNHKQDQNYPRSPMRKWFCCF